MEHFFDKLSVAAIRLSGSLKVGDTIEIGEDSPVRETVASMQIDRKEIDEAGPGDDVGIKLQNRVSAGSNVYLVR
ncbi:MAG: translation elongation factor-like protein [Candidatus Micrarchaeota archaeon]|nr:translation elongation factor-like protein [Candidatus Micrarchaeota archaeon]